MTNEVRTVCNCAFCYYLRFGMRSHECEPKRILKMWMQHQIWADTLVIHYKIVCEKCEMNLGAGVTMMLAEDYFKGGAL